MSQIVITPTYTSKYTRLQTDLVLMERFHQWREGGEEIDGMPHFWLFIFAHFKPGQLAIKREGQTIPIVGDVGIFVPPFGLVHWVLGPGLLEWNCYLSKTPVPAGLPSTPVMFSYSPQRCPLTADEVFLDVQGAESPQPVDKVEMCLAIAEKLKRVIDQSFDSKVTMAKISRDMGVSQEVLGRMFKSCYGTSPGKYRNKLRIYLAQNQLLFHSRPIGQVADEVGFGDVSRFNKTFKQVINSTPSQFIAPEPFENLDSH